MKWVNDGSSWVGEGFRRIWGEFRELYFLFLLCYGYFFYFVFFEGYCLWVVLYIVGF